jgi:nicotinamide riboside kinase
MRVAISGTSNTGKSTLISSFLHTWKEYSTPEKTYRDKLEEGDLPHSAETTADTQLTILDSMIDTIKEYDKNSKVIFDRCPLDNIAYTLWAHAKGVEGIDKKFVDKCIDKAKESFRNIDMILFVRYDDSIKIVDDGTRETDVEYIKEIDNILEALVEQYKQNYDADIFFPYNDSPGIIELPSNPQRRIDMISEYITPEGDFYGEESSIFAPDKLDEMERLVKQQFNAQEAEEADKELFRKFGLDIDKDKLK